MNKKLNKVLLIDDDRPTNFFHEMILRKMGCVGTVESYRGVEEALNHLKELEAQNANLPELIFLDLNMPGLDGWDFIESFRKMDSKTKSEIKIIVLTTSVSPIERRRALEVPEILDFKNKPLNSQLMEEILNGHF